ADAARCQTLPGTPRCVVGYDSAGAVPRKLASVAHTKSSNCRRHRRSARVVANDPDPASSWMSLDELPIDRSGHILAHHRAPALRPDQSLDHAGVQAFL